MSNSQLPVPAHFNADTVGEIWRVPYQQLAEAATRHAQAHALAPAAEDRSKVALLLVDVQNTFCIPGFELFVGGASGSAAVEDNRRLCRFIYRNLGMISDICLSMDTHQAMQIFHPVFLVDDQGRNPAPHTPVSRDDIAEGRWRFNPAVAPSLGIDPQQGQAHLEHYARTLKQGGKYDLTIWPYHAMIGGIGHAIVPAVEAAVFFHTLARSSQPDFQIKGHHPLTENYSILKPEVTQSSDGNDIAAVNTGFLEKLLRFDAVIIAGQAKSHCVAWTVSDLLDAIDRIDSRLAAKVYLLDDCASPVVIPGVVDYSSQAQKAYDAFAEAGMHRVRSTDPVFEWPGFPA
jgi:nicotinamidase-related amidase